jgi:2,3-bisphosphoglycerate-dependent phosphoglycerate mutase
MRTLLLVRHGQSTADIEDRVGGDYDDDLTDLGRSQVRRLAARLAAEYQLDRLYASTLRRAAQTAEAIAAATGVQPVWDDRLREMSTGTLAGMKLAEAAQLHPPPPDGWKLYTRPPGGEMPLDQFRRVAEFYLRLRDQGQDGERDGTVAVVTHGGTLRWLVRLILGLPIDSRVSVAIDDTCLYEFRFRDDTTLVQRMNDTAHLR